MPKGKVVEYILRNGRVRIKYTRVEEIIAPHSKLKPKRVVTVKSRNLERIPTKASSPRRIKNISKCLRKLKGGKR